MWEKDAGLIRVPKKGLDIVTDILSLCHGIDELAELRSAPPFVFNVDLYNCFVHTQVMFYIVFDNVIVALVSTLAVS